MVSNMSMTQLRCPRALPRLLCGPRAPLRWTRSSGALSSGTVHVHPQVEVGGGGWGANFHHVKIPLPPSPHTPLPPIQGCQPEKNNEAHHRSGCRGRQETLWDVLGHLDLPRYHTDDVEPSSGTPEQLGVDFRCPKIIFLPE